MATRLPDGSIKLRDGRTVFANSLVQAQDLIEIMDLIVPCYIPAPSWPFISGGGGGGGGEVGVIGADGADGAAGVQGNQGFQGPADGAPGPQGNQGPEGADGVDGAPGAQGFQGDVGAGVQGAQGNQGVDGADGSQGFQGDVGAGFQGAQGDQGLVGAQGIEGGQGIQGFQGDSGGAGPDIFAATRVVSLVAGEGTDLTIAAAIAALPAEGGKIFIKEGTYPIAATLTLPDKNVAIEGAGDGTIISLGANAIAAFTIPTGLTVQRIYTFEDMKILGTAVASQRGWSVQDVSSRGVVNIVRVDTEEVQFPIEVTDGNSFGSPVYVSATDCHFQQLADNSSVLIADTANEPPVNLAMVRVRFYRTFQDAVVGTFTQGGFFGFTNINIIASDCTFSIGSADCFVGAFNLTDCFLYNFSPGANIRINIGDDSLAAVISAVVGCKLAFVDFDINGNGTKFAECYIESCSFQDGAGSHFANNFIRGIGATPSTAVIASGSGGTIIVGCHFHSTAVGSSYVISRADVVSGCVIRGNPAVAAINVTGGGSKITGNHFVATVPIIETGLITIMENAISGNWFEGGPPTLLAGSETLLDDKNIRTISTTPVTLNQLHRTVLSDATGGARVINLPTAASSLHRTYTIKKIDASANTVTIDASGVETIDGATTQVLTTQYQTVTIQSNGTSWWII